MDKRFRLPLRAQALIAAFFLLMGILGGCTTEKTVQKDTPKAMEPSAKAKTITGIETTEDEENSYVVVNGDQLLTYTSFKQPFPLGVIFYFPETAIGDVESLLEPTSETIEKVKVTELMAKANTTRLEIALKKDVPYEVERDGNGLKIAFRKTEMSAEALTDVEPVQPSEESELPIKPVAETQPPEMQPEDKKPDLSELPNAQYIDSVSVEKLEEGVKIHVKADGVVKDYTSFAIDKPARIVFDLPGLKAPKGRPYKKQITVSVDTPWVNKIRHFGHPDKIRVVLDTNKLYLSSYNARSVVDGLEIMVGKEAVGPTIETGKELKGPQTTVTADKEMPEPAEIKPVSEPPKEKLKEPPKVEEAKSEAKLPEVKYTGPAWINRIDFSSQEEGKSLIIIGTTRPVRYDVEKPEAKKIQLTLFDANLPDYRKRPLITTRFKSAVNRITPIQAAKPKNTALINIDLREDVPHNIEQEENFIMISFAASAIPPKPVEEVALPSWKKIMTQAEPGSETPLEDVVGQAPEKQEEKITEEAAPLPAEVTTKTAPKPMTVEEQVAAQMAAPQPTSKYTGEKIALDFFDTDIKNVFRILREVSGKNFAIDKDVGGKVTLTLEKPVPWDQVLDLILKMNQLGFTYEGDIIRIATIKTLAREKKLKRERILEEQKIRKEEKQLAPLFTEYIPVNYSNAKSDILPHITPMLTKGRGKVSVNDRTNLVILTDTAETIRDAKALILRLDQVTPQVIIESRIVEADKNFSRELGINWNLQAGPRSSNTLGGDVTPFANVDVPTTSTGTIGFTFERLVDGSNFFLDAQLTAAEAEGRSRIISAPKVVTLDNRTATIRQGLRYPYNKLDDSGNTVTVFEDIDLVLEVTPQVTPDQRVLMSLNITKKDLGPVILGNQSFTTKEANTELLINDGETVVIGGIIKTTKTSGSEGIPLFNRIPLMKWLFKNDVLTDNKEELLIFITPRIVQLEQAAATAEAKY